MDPLSFLAGAAFASVVILIGAFVTWARLNRKGK